MKIVSLLSRSASVALRLSAIFAFGVALADGPFYVKVGGDDSADGLSWATAKGSVSAAVTAAAAGGEIRVAQGVYTLSATIALPAAGVTIRGGYDPTIGERSAEAKLTVLSGDKNGNDAWTLVDFSATKPDTAFSYTTTAYGSMISDGKLVLPEPADLGASKFLTPDTGKISDNVAGAFSVLGGVTVIDGLAFVSFQKSGSSLGAAITTESAASTTALTVTNCVFAGMSAGRGVVALKNLSGAVFADSRFLYNRSGRLVEINASNNRFEGCDFIGSWKTGDAGGNVLEFYGGSGTVVSNCLFELNFNATQNVAYGPNNILGWQSHSGVQFVNNTIRENYTKNNVPLIIMAGGVMRNCLFVNNRSQYTSAQAPSVMDTCSLADGCTFISNTAYVAVADATKTILTAPVVVAGTRTPLVNCTFVDNRSYTQDSAAGIGVVKAGVAVVRTTSTTGDACVGLGCCTVWQVENIPVVSCGGVASTGLWPSKIVSSVLRYAGVGTGCLPVENGDAFPVQMLKCSVYGFSTEFGSSVTTTDLVTDDLALEMPTVVDAAHTVPLMRVGARVAGNDDTHTIGNYYYVNAGKVRNGPYLVYDIAGGYQYLLEGGCYVKTSGERIVPTFSEPIADALGKARPAGADQRGAVAELLPAAVTGKTLIVRPKPAGVCTFAGPVTQAVQPGSASRAVTATAVSAGSTFQSWQLEDGTVVSTANPLALDSLAEDSVVYAVYSAAKVTYTFDLGPTGTFNDNHESTIAVQYSIGDTPSVPDYTIDTEHYYEVGWTLPSVVGSENRTFALDYVEKLHRIVRYDSAAAAGGDGESWATAMNDFGAAIAKAGLWTGEVWVKAGIHKPAATASKFFPLMSHVAIKGGFAGIEGETDADRDVDGNRSILSGDLTDNDAWTTSSGRTVSVIDPDTGDFSPFNPGYADDWWWVANFSGDVSAMFDLSTVECDATAVLDGLWMTGCQNFILGGADAHPTVSNCTFIGAGRIWLKGAMTFDGCKFIGSGANDGSTTGCLFCNTTISAPGVVVRNSLFDGIRAGQRAAITCNGGSLPISFDGCTFSHCYMDPSNKNSQNGHSACIGGSGFTATASHCRFVGNKTVYFGNIFVASSVSDSLFESNMIEADAAGFATETPPLLSCGTALRCSFVSNRVTRAGTTTASVSDAVLVRTSGALIGCTFDGNEVSVSLEEGCSATPRAAMVYATGDNAVGIAHCTFVGNTATHGVYRLGGTRKSSSFPLDIVNTVFGDRYDVIFAMQESMYRSVFGWHFVGSWIPGFDDSADFVASVEGVVTNGTPRFASKPVRDGLAEGRLLYRDSAAFRAAVPVFTDADGAWCMTCPDGTTRNLTTYAVVTPAEPLAAYVDAFGTVAASGKMVPGALQTYQHGGLLVIIR